MNEKILELIKHRLDLGAKKYNKENIIADGRKFEQEALEEILDACVYIAARLIEIDSTKTYQWWKDQELIAKEEERDVNSDSDRINKLLPKDPMAIIKRASERLRNELGEDGDDGES